MLDHWVSASSAIFFLPCFSHSVFCFKYHRRKWKLSFSFLLLFDSLRDQRELLFMGRTELQCSGCIYCRSWRLSHLKKDEKGTRELRIHSYKFVVGLFKSRKRRTNMWPNTVIFTAKKWVSYYEIKLKYILQYHFISLRSIFINSSVVTEYRRLWRGLHCSNYRVASRLWYIEAHTQHIQTDILLLFIYLVRKSQ